jgi:hypothetical protein
MKMKKKLKSKKKTFLKSPKPFFKFYSPQIVLQLHTKISRMFTNQQLLRIHVGRFDAVVYGVVLLQAWNEDLGNCDFTTSERDHANGIVISRIGRPHETDLGDGISGQRPNAIASHRHHEVIDIG